MNLLKSRLSHALATRPDAEELSAAQVLLPEGYNDKQHMEHQLAGVAVARGLSKRPDIDALKESGVYQEAGVGGDNTARALESQLLKDSIKHKLEDPSRPSAEELSGAGIRLSEQQQMEHMRAGVQVKHSLEHRASLEDVKAQGIYVEPDEAKAAAAERERAAAALQHSLETRHDVTALQAQGIYHTPMQAAQSALATNMARDHLSHALQPEARPSIEELKAQGIFKDGGATAGSAAALERAMVSDQVAAGLRARPTPEAAAERGLITADDAPVLGDADAQKHEAMKRRQEIMAAQVEKELSKREPLEQLANQGIYVNATPQERGVERAFLQHKLAGALASRPDQEQLENKGVLLEGVDSPEAVREQHREARNVLEGALAVRPSLAELEQQGYLEVDQLEEWFNEMVASNGSSTAGGAEPSVPSSAVLSCEQVKAMVTSGTTSQEAIDATLKEVDTAGTGRLTFAQFLTFVDKIDTHVDGIDAAASVGGDAEGDDEAAKAQRQQAKRARALAAAQAPNLTERLVTHLRARPERSNPEVQRIAHGFKSAEAVSLEQALTSIHLAHSLQRREDLDALKARGVISDQAAAARELEFKFNKRLLDRRLKRRPEADDLVQRGVLPDGDASADHAKSQAAIASTLAGRPGPGELMGRGILKEPPVADAVPISTEAMASRQTHLEESLSARASVKDLKQQGIYMDDAAVRAAQLERLLVHDTLKRKLGDPARPSPAELEAAHILNEAGPSGLSKSEMEMKVASRQVKHGLLHRHSVEELKSRGIYIDTTAEQAANEKLFKSVLLARGLSKHFNPEELEQLKQKGVYKETGGSRLRAEHSIIAAQLGRLMKARPDVEALQAEHPQIMESNELALAFQDRLASPDAQTLSFAALKDWPALTEGLKPGQLEEFFDVCDSDHDGEITFSEFLRLVDLCDANPEVHVTVDDATLSAAYDRLADKDKGLISAQAACDYNMVARWSAQAHLDRAATAALLGSSSAAPASAGEGQWQDKAGFLTFCRACEKKAAEAHAADLAAARDAAAKEGEAAREGVKAALVKKLQARPDYKELKERHIVLGAAPAAALLERNLVANSIKQQLLARPAVDELMRQGILLPEDTAERHAAAAAALEDKLGNRQDDAVWRAKPGELVGGTRDETCNQLSGALAKRSSMEELENKGIYLQPDATGVGYTLMINAVVDVHSSFTKSSAALAEHLGRQASA